MEGGIEPAALEQIHNLELNMECIVAVGTVEEAFIAIETVQASLLYVVGPSTAEKIQLLQDVSPAIQQASRPICVIADILAKDNKGLEEAWQCRDKGFNAVWVSDAYLRDMMM
jgi:hypothetical protein